MYVDVSMCMCVVIESVCVEARLVCTSAWCLQVTYLRLRSDCMYMRVHVVSLYVTQSIEDMF